MNCTVLYIYIFIYFITIHNMHILQWNAQAIRSHGDEFKKSIYERTNKPDIICIQESWLKTHHKFGFSGYEVVRKDRDLSLGKSGGGGVITCVRKGIAYRVVESLDCDDVEVIVVEVFLKGSSSIFVLNVYNTSDHINMEVFEKLFQGIDDKMIVCGDFNAHNTLWGSIKNDKNGRLVEDMLEDYDLVCLNDGTGTRIDRRTGRLSCLDLSMVSRKFGAEFTWFVEDCAWDSDHFPVVFSMHASFVYNKANFIPKWSLKKANWKKFHSECVNRITFPQCDDFTDNIYDTFVNQLNGAVEASIPKTKPCSAGKSPVPWWTDKCSEAVREKKVALNRLKRTALPSDYINFKKKRAEARKIIKTAKKCSWESYCSSITSKTSPSEVWNKVKSISKANCFRGIQTLVDVDKKCAISDKEKAELLAKSFAKVSSNLNYDPEFLCEKEQVENDLVIKDDNIGLPINDKFTLEELNYAIDRAKCTTPGDDGIGAGILKQLPICSCKILLCIFNLFWERGECPSKWKEAILTPIIKPGKVPSNPASYRPIALTSVICKMMERMITNRLQWYLERGNFIDKAQSGFRAGRKTIDHLVHLESSINTGRANKESTLAVFLDLEKAYDMVWRKGVIVKMQVMGLCGRIIKWIDDFLTNRYIRVKVNGILSGFKYVQNGVPQGSVVSPTLFNIAVCDLPDKITKVKVTQFADDICIWKTSRNINFLKKQVQSELLVIESWCKKWGFRLSAPKSVGILFTQKRKVAGIDLKISEKSIDIKKSAKFLGLIFDSHLTWGDHIEYILKRCKARLNLLRCISGSKWGASSSSLKNVYMALIKPLLEYGCQAFDSAADSVKNKLNKVQYQALRICAGAISRTSLAKLQVECGDPPLQLSRDRISNIMSRVIMSMESHPNRYLFEENWQLHYFSEKWLSKCYTPFYVRAKSNDQNMFYKPVLSFPYWLLPKLDVHLTILPGLEHVNDIYERREIAIQNIQGKWKMALHVFTDGSVDKVRGRVGCGFYVPEFKYEGAFRLADNISIFNAELMAIYFALLWVADVQPMYVCIFSDCVAALQTLTHFVSSNAIVLDIKHLLLSIKSQGICVNFDWVPGHCNIAGNERADSVAKRASKKAKIDVALNPSMSEVKSEEKVELLTSWQLEWNEYREDSVLKQIKPVVNLHMNSWDANRADEVVFRRLRMGLGKGLNSYQMLLNNHLDGFCNTCQKEDTVSHFLLECKKYDIQRIELKNGVSDNVSCNFSLKGLLGGSYAPFKEVVEYVKKCKMDI